MKQTPGYGTNFDNLADKFERKVYGGLKGSIRLAVLKNDLTQFFPAVTEKADPSRRIHILDAGGGHGPFSIQLALLGHRVTICDISSKMLDKARRNIEQKGLIGKVALIHKPVQSLPAKTKYDLVLCHAVIDWVDDPKKFTRHLSNLMHKNGMLSLTFYNLHGMVFKNLLRANYKKILNKQFKGWPGSLTPAHPQTPLKVIDMLSQLNFKVMCQSGIRVFSDYILNLDDREKQPDTVLKLELEYSRKMPYRDLGRYQHILACKK